MNHASSRSLTWQAKAAHTYLALQITLRSQCSFSAPYSADLILTLWLCGLMTTSLKFSDGWCVKCTEIDVKTCNKRLASSAPCSTLHRPTTAAYSDILPWTPDGCYIMRHQILKIYPFSQEIARYGSPVVSASVYTWLQGCRAFTLSNVYLKIIKGGWEFLSNLGKWCCVSKKPVTGLNMRTVSRWGLLDLDFITLTHKERLSGKGLRQMKHESLGQMFSLMMDLVWFGF